LPVDPVPPVTVPPVTVLAGALPAGALPPVPVLVDPVLVDPVAGPSDAVSVGLVLAPPEPGELDAGVAGVEEPLPGVDEDAGALGLAVLDGLAVPAGHGVAVALADALPLLPPVLAFAEAVELAVLAAVAVTVPVSGAVVVVVPAGLVLPSPGPSLVPLSVALSDGLLTELAGVSLGVADVGLACLAGADDAEPDLHAIAGTPLWPAEVPPPAPPAAEPI
jgi:hypothetical protein